MTDASGPPDGDAGGTASTGSRFRNPPLPDRSGRKRDGDVQPLADPVRS